MQESILKSEWERHSQPIEVNIQTAQLLLNPITKETPESLALLTNGCANSNYKITMQNGRVFLLRIYMRDKTSLSREIGINKLINTFLPVSNFLHADGDCVIFPYPYAIMEYKNGILMRDLIFSHDQEAITDVMNEAGLYLSMLHAMKLPYGGFFDEDMQIKPFDLEEEYFGYMMQLLQDEIVAQTLGKNLQESVRQIITQSSNALPEINDVNLTHGDYDPSNMLVHQQNGVWKISAILDWEFAHSGSYLLDVGLMLRYSHKLPAYFEDSFIKGIHDGGAHLPSDWKMQSKLMDLLCLMQLLQASSPAERPNLHRDAVRLITHFVQAVSQS